MERDLKYLAELETYNNGKPMKDAVFDIYGAMYALKYYAGWADKIHGQTIPAGNPYFTFQFLFDFYVWSRVIIIEIYNLGVG